MIYLHRIPNGHLQDLVITPVQPSARLRTMIGIRPPAIADINIRLLLKNYGMPLMPYRR
jgi:hypothetical protein